jgi:hypothetical protein
MPRGTPGTSSTRYAVRLTVPRRGGWRAWIGGCRADLFYGLLGILSVQAAEMSGQP